MPIFHSLIQEVQENGPCILNAKNLPPIRFDKERESFHLHKKRTVYTLDASHDGKNKKRPSYKFSFLVEERRRGKSMTFKIYPVEIFNTSPTRYFKYHKKRTTDLFNIDEHAQHWAYFMTLIWLNQFYREDYFTKYKSPQLNNKTKK